MSKKANGKKVRRVKWRRVTDRIERMREAAAAYRLTGRKPR